LVLLCAEQPPRCYRCGGTEADAIREARAAIEAMVERRCPMPSVTNAMNNDLGNANRARPHLSADSVINPIDRVSCTARYFSQNLLPLVLTVAVLSSVPGCGSLHLNPDPAVAPSRTADRAWTPPLSLTNGDDRVSKLDQLRRFDETEVRRLSVTGAYDLPALIDLALKTNPQTRRLVCRPQS
jgi:hypothetical protein